jgi:hypothetical protein
MDLNVADLRMNPDIQVIILTEGPYKHGYQI